MQWNTYAPGHEAPSGTSKHAYDARTDRGEFHLWPEFGARTGRFLGYRLWAANTKGCFPPTMHTGMWHDLGLIPTLKDAKRRAKALYDSCVQPATAQEPRDAQDHQQA